MPNHNDNFAAKIDIPAWLWRNRANAIQNPRDLERFTDPNRQYFVGPPSNLSTVAPPLVNPARQSQLTNPTTERQYFLGPSARPTKEVLAATARHHAPGAHDYTRAEFDMMSQRRADALAASKAPPFLDPRSPSAIEQGLRPVDRRSPNTQPTPLYPQYAGIAYDETEVGVFAHERFYFIDANRKKLDSVESIDSLMAVELARTTLDENSNLRFADTDAGDRQFNEAITAVKNFVQASRESPNIRVPFADDDSIAVTTQQRFFDIEYEAWVKKNEAEEARYAASIGQTIPGMAVAGEQDDAPYYWVKVAPILVAKGRIPDTSWPPMTVPTAENLKEGYGPMVDTLAIDEAKVIAEENGIPTEANRSNSQEETQAAIDKAGLTDTHEPYSSDGFIWESRRIEAPTEPKALPSGVYPDEPTGQAVIDAAGANAYKMMDFGNDGFYHIVDRPEEPVDTTGAGVFNTGNPKKDLADAKAALEDLPGFELDFSTQGHPMLVRKSAAPAAQFNWEQMIMKRYNEGDIEGALAIDAFRDQLNDEPMTSIQAAQAAAQISTNQKDFLTNFREFTGKDPETGFSPEEMAAQQERRYKPPKPVRKWGEADAEYAERVAEWEEKPRGFFDIVTKPVLPGSLTPPGFLEEQYRMPGVPDQASADIAAELGLDPNMQGLPTFGPEHLAPTGPWSGPLEPLAPFVHVSELGVTDPVTGITYKKGFPTGPPPTTPGGVAPPIQMEQAWSNLPERIKDTGRYGPGMGVFDLSGLPQESFEGVFPDPPPLSFGEQATFDTEQRSRAKINRDIVKRVNAENAAAQGFRRTGAYNI